MSTPATAPPPLPHKRKRLRWVLLALFVLLLVGVWLAPGVLANTSLKDRIVADLTADVNGKVTVGAVQLNWLHPVEAADVSVVDAAGKPVLSAKRVSTSKSLLALAFNRADLGTLTVHEPRAEVVFEGGTTNVQKVFGKYLAPGPSKPTRPAVAVELLDGSVRLTDAASGEASELTAVGAKATVPANTADAITFHATAANGGTITADGELGPASKLTLAAADFDLASLSPAVRAVRPDARLAGRLRSNLTVNWTPRDDAPPAFVARGDVHLSGVSVSAAELGAAPVRLASVDVPLALAFDGRAWQVEKVSLTCDAGTVRLAGTFDPAAPPETLLATAGVEFDADLDVARLAAVAPGLLRLKPGTELTAGKITATVRSGKTDKGVAWAGALSALRVEGRRDGKAITWEEPLAVSFAGRIRPDGLPAFDKLTVQSDFIGGQARGEPESFDAVADLDLTKLGARLDSLFDLNGLRLDGSAKKLTVQVRPKADGGFTLTAGGTINDLAVSDNTGVLVSDPKLVLSASADGTIRGGTVRVDAGRLDVTAGTDTLAVSLTEPVADVKALASGKASVTLTGDLKRWQGRVGRVAGWPKDWAVGGTATEASAVVRLGGVMTAEKVRVGITAAAFTGLGLTLDEPDLRLDSAADGSVTFDPKTGAVVFTRVAVRSDTVSGAVSRLELTPVGKGDFGGSGKANVSVRLDRLQKTLGLQKAADLSDQFRGTATGIVDLTAPTFDRLNFVVDLAVTGFAFGPPKRPVWTEPSMSVKGGVGLHLSADTLTLTNAVVERDGLSVSGSGTVAKMTTAMEVDVSGTLGYDLAKLEPVLKQFLGPTASASGADRRPFRAKGSVFGRAGFDATDLSASAGLSWTSLKAYGFDVGKGELTATAEKGVVTTTPVTAAFGGGTVRAEPTLRLTPGTFDLSVKPGRVVDKTKLTPAACADALGFALPAVANAAQAEGSVSFDVADNRFPLSDPSAGGFKGTLTIHDGSITPGPALAHVLEFFDLKSPRVQLAKDSQVPVELKDGWVTHSNLILTVGNTALTTSGRVHVSGTMDLTVNVPVGGTVAEKLLPGHPALRAALAKQAVGVKVRGTLGKPELDADGMRQQLQAVVTHTLKDAAKEKGQHVLDDALKGGLDKILRPKK